jgi:hypothetical protein
MDGGLLVSCVNDAKVLIRHHVQNGQNMVASEGENILDTFQLERFADQMTSGDSGHVRLLIAHDVPRFIERPSV